MKINLTRQHLEIYITENSQRSLRASKEYIIYEDVLVLVKDPLPQDIDLHLCLQNIEMAVPGHLVYGLDTIIIGQFPEFKERTINAFYKDGAIYITNEQDDNDDFIDDVVHEIAHLVEETYGSVVYEDKKIMREFLGKRQRLFYILKSEGYDVAPKDFITTTYSQNFDEFLFKEVGYPLLTQLTLGLFLTPYGVTSLAEYFAESFEYYLLKDPGYVKKISPACYKVVQDLAEGE